MQWWQIAQFRWAKLRSIDKYRLKTQLHIPSDLQINKIELVNDKVSISFFVDKYKNAAHNHVLWASAF